MGRYGRMKVNMSGPILINFVNAQPRFLRRGVVLNNLSTGIILPFYLYPRLSIRILKFFGGKPDLVCNEQCHFRM
jgi:hypothetical protein